jgi:hypothetical protein
VQVNRVEEGELVVFSKVVGYPCSCATQQGHAAGLADAYILSIYSIHHLSLEKGEKNELMAILSLQDTTGFSVAEY